jgi:hypothetical protein
MKSTEKKNSEKALITKGENEEKAHCSVSKDLSIRQENQALSKNLSMNVAEHLLHLMRTVTKDEVSPSTVQSACHCAQQMYNLMKLNLEVKKQGF